MVVCCVLFLDFGCLFSYSTGEEGFISYRERRGEEGVSNGKIFVSR